MIWPFIRLWPVPQDLQHWKEYVPGSVASISTGTDSPFFNFQQSSPKMKARPGGVLVFAPSGNALMCRPCVRSDETTSKRTLSPTFRWITGGSNSKSFAVMGMIRGGVGGDGCGFSLEDCSACGDWAEICLKAGATNASTAATASRTATRTLYLKIKSPVKLTERAKSAAALDSFVPRSSALAPIILAVKCPAAESGMVDTLASV